ncbi:MAG TPA: methyltransferase [Chroococcales cyanobacterium]
MALLGLVTHGVTHYAGQLARHSAKQGIKQTIAQKVLPGLKNAADKTSGSSVSRKASKLPGKDTIDAGKFIEQANTDKISLERQINDSLGIPNDVNEQVRQEILREIEMENAAKAFPEVPPMPTPEEHSQLMRDLEAEADASTRAMSILPEKKGKRQQLNPAPTQGETIPMPGEVQRQIANPQIAGYLPGYSQVTVPPEFIDKRHQLNAAPDLQGPPIPMNGEVQRQIGAPEIAGLLPGGTAIHQRGVETVENPNLQLHAAKLPKRLQLNAAPEPAEAIPMPGEIALPAARESIPIEAQKTIPKLPGKRVEAPISRQTKDILDMTVPEMHEAWKDVEADRKAGHPYDKELRSNLADAVTRFPLFKQAPPVEKKTHPLPGKRPSPSVGDRVSWKTLEGEEKIGTVTKTGSSVTIKGDDGAAHAVSVEKLVSVDRQPSKGAENSRPFEESVKTEVNQIIRKERPQATEQPKVYRYGIKARPASPGAVPKGHVETAENPNFRHYELHPIETTPPEVTSAPSENRGGLLLRKTADTIEAKAKGELGRDRLSNTPKRAREAEYAEKNAREQIRIAETLRNIADAHDAGKTEHLAGVRNKSQVDTLETALNNSKYEAGRKNQERWDANRDRNATEEDVKYAKYPYPHVHRSNLSQLAELAGDKKALALAKKNVTSDQVLYLKDWNDRATVEKLISGARKKGVDNYKVKLVQDGFDDYNRLKAMGIHDEANLKNALVEYLRHRSDGSRPDPIKAMERELIGTKIPGYFPTPRGTVEKMLDAADIQSGHKVLEPSAGKGNIADAIRQREPKAELKAIEQNHTLHGILKAKGHDAEQGDFLSHKGEHDRIVMNPPFENGQDMEHVRHAFDQLKPGGKMVSIMSESPFFRQERKAQEFRDWLEEVGGKSEKLPEGTFKDSERSTGVATRMVTIEKPKEGFIERAKQRFEEQRGSTGVPEDGHEVGDFGPVFRDFKGDAKGAIKKLMETKDGEAIGALHHPEIGDIDLVWGKTGTPEKDYEDGSGLAKIARKHPDVLSNLQEILLRMKVVKRGENRIRLATEDDAYRAVVRLDWDGKSKKWLLTEYWVSPEERRPASTGERTGASGTPEGAGGTLPPKSRSGEIIPETPQKKNNEADDPALMEKLKRLISDESGSAPVPFADKFSEPAEGTPEAMWGKLISHDPGKKKIGIKEHLDRLYTRLVDKDNPIKLVEQKAGGDGRSYREHRNLNGGSAIEMIKNDGIREFDNPGVVASKSLSAIIKDIQSIEPVHEGSDPEKGFTADLT